MKMFINQILETIKKYYITLLFFMIASTKLINVLYNDYYNKLVDINEAKFILTFIFGAIIAIAVRHIMDRVDKYSYLLYLIIPISMILLYFIVLGDLSTFTNALRYFILILVISISLFIIPFIGKDNDSNDYTYNALISLLITIFSYILIIIGVIFTLTSLESLFDLNIKEYIYPSTLIFILGFIMPTLFLSLIPNENKKGYHEFTNKIINYVIYPILGIYNIILYLYFLRILILLEWPSNSLGFLVGIYSLVSIVVLYFTNNKIDNKLIKLYPYLLIIPNIMMFITFIIRINAYGVTIFRYYGVLMFVFSMISVLILVFKKQVKNIIIFLMTLLLLSVIGPLSASNISFISQKNRLDKLLIKNNMLVNNEIVINKDISEEDKQLIINIIYYLDANHGLDKIKYLKDDFKLSDINEVFGFNL
jgi:hypothetical protein